MPDVFSHNTVLLRIFCLVICLSVIFNIFLFNIETNYLHLFLRGIRDRNTSKEKIMVQRVECKDMLRSSSYNDTKAKRSCNALKYFHQRNYVRVPGPMGRLGNMMFQFVATLGIADTLGYRPVIKSNHPLLKTFDINPEYISDKELVNVQRIGESQWQNESWRRNNNISSKNITLDGYFQSWKYFSNIADCIPDLLKIKARCLEKAKEYLKQKLFQAKTVIGIHVRRGDMLTHGSQRIGRLVASRDYLRKAMHFYRTQCSNAHFIVCSDDMMWSRRNINSSDVSFSNFRDPAVDMAILSLCDHVIVTVGTFGWWGGWLSGGTVTYLSDFPRNGSDLDKWQPKASYYPPTWVGMNNSFS